MKPTTISSLIFLGMIFFLAFISNSAISNSSCVVNNEVPTYLVDIYVFSIIVNTTSDWTTIRFENSTGIFGFNYTIIAGDNVSSLNIFVGNNEIYISKQPMDTRRVVLRVNYLSLLSNDTSIIIRKGDIGYTQAIMLTFNGESFIKVANFINNGTNPEYPGTNDMQFNISRENLYVTPATTAVLEDISNALSKCVFAFYYPWYGTPYGETGEWSHWENVTWNDIGSSKHYPLLGVYDSRDARTIRAQIIMAKASGIDGFIASWWGPNSNEDSVFAKLLNIAEQLGFKVTVYLESFRPWDPSWMTSPSSIANEIIYVVEQYGDSNAFLRVGGRPVIFVYQADAFGRNASFWEAVRREVESNIGPVILVGDIKYGDFASVFDGFHTYIELNLTSMHAIYTHYITDYSFSVVGTNATELIEKALSGQEIVLQKKALFYTVMPGYDDTKVRSPGTKVDRKGGETFIEYWQDALELGADKILITSWNEYHEGTEIEPTREFGFRYLNITRMYTELLKGETTSIEGTPSPTLALIIHNDNLALKITNNGSIAIGVKIVLNKQDYTNIISGNQYLQPSKDNELVLLVPSLDEGDKLWVNLTTNNITSIKDDGLKIPMVYYDLHGHNYSKIFNYNWIIEEKTITKTITKTKSQTTTKTTTYTKTTTETKTMTKTKTNTITETMTNIETKTIVEKKESNALVLIAFIAGSIVSFLALRFGKKV